MAVPVPSAFYYDDHDVSTDAVGADFTTICAACGKVISSADPSWQESVTLAPDLLCVGMNMASFRQAVTEINSTYDWCNIVCFGRTLFMALEVIGAPTRECAE